MKEVSEIRAKLRHSVETLKKRALSEIAALGVIPDAVVVSCGEEYKIKSVHFYITMLELKGVTKKKSGEWGAAMRNIPPDFELK